ncbi:unnamed protein product [Prorocentrum cordatum]|uniref:Uncharacterized protein n=1 Tax=Prorocentrum cordatum TaxID=2364126 RepID=A0ABN9PQ82_9DINO|nr:unnamed protein product [Polarella glacialis]
MEKSTTGRGINETHMTWPPVESQERGRETGALPRTSAIKGARPPPARWRIHPPTHLGIAAPPCKRQREYFVPMDAACPAARRGSEDFGHGAARRSTSRRPPVAAVGRGRAEQPRQTVARARARAQEGEEEEEEEEEDRQGIERESPGKTMLRLPGAWLVRSRSPAKSWQNKQLGQQRVDEPTAILHKQANTFASKHSSWSTTELQWRAGHEASPNG